MTWLGGVLSDAHDYGSAFGRARAEEARREQRKGYPEILKEHGRVGHPEMYWLGMTVTILAAGTFIAANIVTFSFAGPISLVALSILTAVTYGIINDQIACRKCIEYFTVGHTQFHRRLLATDNPTLNGIVWGIHATWVLGAIAGVIMGGTAALVGVTASQVLLFVAPVLAVGVVGVSIYSHIRAKAVEKEWNMPENRAGLDAKFDGQWIDPSPGFHPVDLSAIPKEKRAAYVGVGARNLTGYIAMPALGAVTLIEVIALGLIL